MTLASMLLPVANGPVEQLKMSLALGFANVAAPLLKLRFPFESTWPTTLPYDAWVLIVKGLEVYVDQTIRSVRYL